MSFWTWWWFLHSEKLCRIHAMEHWDWWSRSLCRQVWKCVRGPQEIDLATAHQEAVSVPWPPDWRGCCAPRATRSGDLGLAEPERSRLWACSHLELVEKLPWGRGWEDCLLASDLRHSVPRVLTRPTSNL